jgi:membrane associated rhomboid family serine protease
MDQTSLPPPPPARALERCYRHPDVETGVHCTRCGRPICPDCMIPAPVGHQCPECVKEARQEFRRPSQRVAVGANRGLSLTNVLLAVLAGVYVIEAVVAGPAALITGPGGHDLIRLGASVGIQQQPDGSLVGIVLGQYWRLFTATFLHAGLLHLAFNGYALYLFGNVVERELGRGRFLIIYVVTGVCASVASYAFGVPIAPSVGASGAIFGIFGAFLAYSWRRRDLAFYAARVRSAGMLILLNLFISVALPGIDWRAHLGGLVTGIVAGAAADGLRDHRARTATFAVVVVALTVAAVGLTAWRTEELRTTFARVLG